GQTLLLEYETPDGQPIQEWNSVALSDLRRILPAWILNGCLYADIRFSKGLRSEWLLHIQTLHQANRFFWPTGLLLGVSWLYTGANTL
ncbi:MAG: hypothetical protein RMK98_01530, partial [Bacteroidia bacterium]|nr:hypothetical protein [Bacteroidia bacterium]